MSKLANPQSLVEWMGLPEPDFPKLRSPSEDGSTYMVKKVGFLAVPGDHCTKAGIAAMRSPDSKGLLPTAVVVFDDEDTLCKLPVELGEWVFSAVSMAQSGMNPFPCDVEFGVLDGRTYAEFAT